MYELLPENIAIVTLGGHGARLGRDLRGALPGARLHGPRAYSGEWDESYDRVSPHIASIFQAGQSIIGVCASGILIRSVAPFLSAKSEEPPVVLRHVPTAWNLLMHVARLTCDETVLIMGAGGNLGTIGIQIAKNVIGARVIAAAGSDVRVTLGRKLGAGEARK